MPTAQIGELTFDSDFDSGNAQRFEQTDEHEFSLFTANDCEGTEFEKGFRTWFCFSVRGVAQRGRLLTFLVYNMNPQGVLFRQGHRPVYRSLPSKPAWERLAAATAVWPARIDRLKKLRQGPVASIAKQGVRDMFRVAPAEKRGYVRGGRIIQKNNSVRLG